MDIQDFVQLLENEHVGSADMNRMNLTLETVRKYGTIVTETDSHIIFKVERHPFVGDEWHPSEADVTVQTWRFNREDQTLEIVCEIHRYSYIEQDELGEPLCANCGEQLDRHSEVFDYTWWCPSCGARGGQKDELVDPSYGEPVIKDLNKWTRLGEKDVWVPSKTD